MTLQTGVSVRPVAVPPTTVPAEQAIATSSPTCGIDESNDIRDIWVTLLQLPSEMASDEALLLCRKSEDTWAVWVPNHGETVLHQSSFRYPAD